MTDPAGSLVEVLAALTNSQAALRSTAVEALAQTQDPELLPWLVDATRDPSPQVRVTALEQLAAWQPAEALIPQARGALVAALWDAEAPVKQRARALLEEAEPPRPPRLVPWQVLQRRLHQVLVWGRQVGQTLLGREVVLGQNLAGLGQTAFRKVGPVPIEISDLPLTQGAPHGEEVVRGLILHELGHQLYDHPARGFLATKGVARSEGVGRIFAVLMDERLERRLGARRAEWGRALQRLGAYAFAHREHRLLLADLALRCGLDPQEAERAIRRRDLPGRLVRLAEGEALVVLQGWDRLRVPRLLGVHDQFLLYLRAGFRREACRDPRVLEALACVPGRLKDLTHPELLEVSREIGRRLGESEELPPPPADLSPQDWSGHGCSQRHDHAHGRARAPRCFDPLSAAELGQKRPPVALPGGSSSRSLDPAADFPELVLEEQLPYDAQAQRELVGPIRKQVQVLRGYLLRLSQSGEVEEEAMRRGRRLDHVRARRAALLPELNLLVARRPVLRTDAYLGVVIDRSASMEGASLQRAKAFAALVAEGARGVPGISGHVSAFDHQTFVRLGDLKRPAIAPLTTCGGNNDAGALLCAARLAIASGRRNVLLVMISDGAPSQCSVEALRQLVRRLTGRGIVCAQVAVAPLSEVAFPHYVDLSQHGFDEAVTRFGLLVTRLTRAWR